LTLPEALEAQYGSPGDPRREHLRTCPSCQALLRAHALFLDPRDLPAAADPEDADRRLDDFLAREISGRRPRSRHHLLSWPLALAAAVVFAVGLSFLWSPHEATPPVVIPRGETGVDSLLHLAPPRREAGGVRLTWTGLSEGSLTSGGPAPDYRVRILDARHTLVTELDAGSDTTMLVDATALSGGQEILLPLLARIVELQDGRVVSRSAPRTLPR
jgi:hypothetical protein